jgi:hypothetical protein
MFADPGGMHADFVCIEGLIGDIRSQLVRGARIVFVVIIAQGEVAKFHGLSSLTT